MKFRKLASYVMLTLSLSGVVVPSLVATQRVYATEQTSVLSVPAEEVRIEILKDIKNQMLPELELEQPVYQNRAALGLMTTLIAKYGVRYVKKQLPKLIYSHISKFLGRKVSEQTFVRIFGNIVDWGTGAVLEQALAGALKSLGVDSGTANTVASVVVFVGRWFI